MREPSHCAGREAAGAPHFGASRPERGRLDPRPRPQGGGEGRPEPRRGPEDTRSSPGPGGLRASSIPSQSPRDGAPGSQPRPAPPPLPVAGVDPRRLARVVVDVEDAAVVVARLLPAGGQRQLGALPGCGDPRQRWRSLRLR